MSIQLIRSIHGRSHQCMNKSCRDGIRFLSSNVVDKDEGFTLSKKQRKALRLVNDEGDEPIETATSEEDQAMRDAQLATTLRLMKEQEELQELQRRQEKPQPWLNLLVYPSRALWRSSPKAPPEYITDSQTNILRQTERTAKQLRRTRDHMSTSHKVLSQKREKERRRLVNGSSVNDTSLLAKKRRGQEKAAKLVYYNAEQTSVSLRYRFVPNYSITKRILAETQGLLGKEIFQPKKVLDVGMGTGSASAAVLDYFHEDLKEKDSKIEWIHGIEPSQSMRDASKIILESVMEGQKQSGGRKTTRFTVGETIVPPPTSESREVRSAGTFDLAICAYTLCELPTVGAGLTMGAIMWEKLAEGGVAIFIEPGTPDGFSSLRSIRNMLLDCCPPEGEDMLDGNEECHVIAPCTHNGECPMIRHQRNFKKEKVEDDSAEEESVEYDELFGMDNDDAEEEIVEDDDFDLDDFDIEDLDGLDDIDNHGGKFKEADPAVPAEKTDVFSTAFCSFVHGMPGKGTRNGEKFSYLVVQKRITGSNSYNDVEHSSNPFQSTDVAGLLKQSLKAGMRSKRSKKAMAQVKSEGDLSNHIEEAVNIEDRFLDSNADILGLELVRGENRKSWGRIMRAPIKKKGHVVLDYCASTRDDEGEIVGRIVRSKVTKRRSAKAAPGMYMSSRKARWGGLWPDITDNSKD